MQILLHFSLKIVNISVMMCAIFYCKFLEYQNEAFNEDHIIVFFHSIDIIIILELVLVSRCRNTFL